jgi:hypothetical protein
MKSITIEPYSQHDKWLGTLAMGDDSPSKRANIVSYLLQEWFLNNPQAKITNISIHGDFSIHLKYSEND